MPRKKSKAAEKDKAKAPGPGPGPGVGFRPGDRRVEGDPVGDRLPGGRVAAIEEPPEEGPEAGPEPYHFVGDTPFIEAAAARHGSAKTPAEVRALRPLQVLTSLASQASIHDREGRRETAREVAAEAAKQYEVLVLGCEAAGTIVGEMFEALGMDEGRAVRLADHEPGEQDPGQPTVMALAGPGMGPAYDPAAFEVREPDRFRLPDVDDELREELARLKQDPERGQRAARPKSFFAEKAQGAPVDTLHQNPERRTRRVDQVGPPPPGRDRDEGGGGGPGDGPGAVEAGLGGDGAREAGGEPDAPVDAGGPADDRKGAEEPFVQGGPGGLGGDPADPLGVD